MNLLCGVSYFPRLVSIHDLFFVTLHRRLLSTCQNCDFHKEQLLTDRRIQEVLVINFTNVIIPSL